MQSLAKAARQLGRRAFHSSSVTKSADYEHRLNMYELWNMKNRKLKMGLGVSAVVLGGVGIPLVAVQMQFWKAKG